MQDISRPYHTRPYRTVQDHTCPTIQDQTIPYISIQDHTEPQQTTEGHTRANKCTQSQKELCICLCHSLTQSVKFTQIRLPTQLKIPHSQNPNVSS